MNILILPGFFCPSIGGSEKSAMDFVKACQSRGGKVIVVARMEKGSLPFELLGQIPIYRIKYPLLSFHQKNFINAAFVFTQSFFHILLIVLKFKPDIIYVHLLLENAVMASLITYLYRPRLIVSCQGGDWILYKINRIIAALLQRLLNKAEIITAPSELLIRRVKSRTEYYLDVRKFRVIPNGIDLENFDKRKDVFVLPDKRHYVFACGRLVIDKGFDILLRAFALLSDAYPEIDIIIAGDGEERSSLESLAEKLNITHRVHLIGMLPSQEIVSYYCGALFFVLSSRREALPYAALEAMAASKAVIGSREATADELIKDGLNGYLFDSEDYNTLAEKMKFLIENRTLRDQLGSNGRRHIEQYYRRDIIDQKIAEMIFS